MTAENSKERVFPSWEAPAFFAMARFFARERPRMTEQHRNRSTEAFFGRRKGKPLRALQASHLETVLPALRLDLETPAPADLRTLYRHPVDRIRLEIGFGGGEHLIHRAVEAPTTGFIGVEPFVNSMAKLVGHIEERGVENIRL